MVGVADKGGKGLWQIRLIKSLHRHVIATDLAMVWDLAAIMYRSNAFCE